MQYATIDLDTKEVISELFEIAKPRNASNYSPDPVELAGQGTFKYVTNDTAFNTLTHMVSSTLEFVELDPIETSYITEAILPLTVEQLDALKAVQRERLGNTRAAALDKFNKYSSGVLRIYSENLTAALRFQASDTTLMVDGKTPTEFLALGARMGMDEATFAQYIIDENARLGPNMWDVEDQYLACAALFDAGATLETITTAIDTYQQFCAGTVTN